MNIENENIERKSTERPEDEWIERFSSMLVGGLFFKFLPAKLGNKVNAAISAVIGYDLKRLISSPPKKFNNLLYDLFYQKQLNEYWNSNREEVYKKILRQTELFGINSSLSKTDVGSYIQQWIKENPMYAKQFPSMIETAISYSQQMLDDAKGGDVIDFYKKQLLSFIDWKEKYDRAYSTISQTAIPPINFKAINTNIKIPQKTDIKKASAINKIEKPSTGVESIFGTVSENIESQGYSGSGFSLGNIGNLALEIGAEINLEKDDLAPALEDAAAGVEEISNKKMPLDEVSKFNDSLLTASFYGQQIGGAFMNIDENIGKAISSTATLTEGVAGIFKAFEGAEVNGLGLMSGIQGAFAGLQGLFGGAFYSNALHFAAHQ